MKALLIKDYWMLWSDYKRLLVLPFISIVIGFAAEQSFWLLWPVYLIGLMPYVLCSYEEQSRWDLYAESMPYGRRTIVRGKFLLLVINSLVGTLVISVIYLIARLFGSFSGSYLEIAVLCICGSLLPGSIMMPFLFKFGVAKSRMVYMICIGLLGVISGLFTGSDGAIVDVLSGILPTPVIMVLLCVALLIVSERLSERFYLKREL